MKNFLSTFALAGFLSLGMAEDDIAIEESSNESESELLEDLLNVEIYTASKYERTLMNTPAGAYVITSEDIRRMGATSIPDALRLAPGTEVLQIDSNKWGVGIRGDMKYFSNKLMVLKDGRSLYDRTFSGTYWDQEETLLDNIEQIEVIRGPAGTLWGANAFNGVINIITKSAEDTQGLFYQSELGTDLWLKQSARYGGKINEDAYHRIYSHYAHQDGFEETTAGDRSPEWNHIRGGMRIDWTPYENVKSYFIGDYYSGSAGETLALNVPSTATRTTFRQHERYSGGYFIANFLTDMEDAGQLTTRLSYTGTERTVPNVAVARRNVVELIAQHDVEIGERFILNYGLQYEFSLDDYDGTPLLVFNPRSRIQNTYAAFLQAELIAIPDHLSFIFGSRFEEHDFTGFEIQPTFRTLITPNENLTFWGGVSRAVRTPDRAARDYTFIQSPVTTGATNLEVQSARGFDSETVVSFELGYRQKITPRVFLDTTLYYNDIDNLVSANVVTANPAVGNALPNALGFTSGNDGRMEIFGVEVGSDLEPFDWWKIRSSFNYTQIQEHTPGAVNTDGREGRSPHAQASIHSQIDITRDIDFDLTFHFVDNVPTFGTQARWNADFRLAWRPIDQLELAAIGKNLTDPKTLQFTDPDLRVSQTEIPRSFIFQVTYRY